MGSDSITWKDNEVVIRLHLKLPCTACSMNSGDSYAGYMILSVRISSSISCTGKASRRYVDVYVRLSDAYA